MSHTTGLGTASEKGAKEVSDFLRPQEFEKDLDKIMNELVDRKGNSMEWKVRKSLLSTYKKGMTTRQSAADTSAERPQDKVDEAIHHPVKLEITNGDPQM